MSEVDEDVPQLSADTFKALMEFYSEEEEREKQKKLTGPDALPDIMKGNLTILENWQLSQFWYDEKTIDFLVEAALKIRGTNGNIALVCCPSLYKKMKQKADKDCEIILLEYDKRFAVYGTDFVLYDYHSPLSIPKDKSSCYDVVIADPPFLSDECLTKTTDTIKFLAKDKIILCTGAIMSDLVQKLLNLKKCSFEPKHKNNLANEFWCYTNFDMDSLL